jgi:L-fuconolactonase
MKTIDAHQHFWEYHPDTHSWINDEMACIRKDFMPSDLIPVYQQNHIDYCIAVQAEQTKAENNLLLNLAGANDFIAGIVGWIDLKAADIHDQLSQYKAYKKMKGFRHILQAEPASFMLDPDFLRGIAALKKYGFTYDVLVYPNQLDAVMQLIQLNPDQPFVIDHLAKPYIKKGEIAEWKNAIQKLAAFPNVYCKISGMVTEADYTNWKTADFTPYIDVVVDAFGTKRIMYGSDWPVCLVAATYQEVLNITQQYFASFTQTEQADFFYNNAHHFYQLSTT